MTQNNLQNACEYRRITAYKIGARARKFAAEGCPIEGYEYLWGCLQDAQTASPEMYALLQEELTKYERYMAKTGDETDV